jgi:hypothetical protein
MLLEEDRLQEQCARTRNYRPSEIIKLETNSELRMSPKVLEIFVGRGGEEEASCGLS